MTLICTHLEGSSGFLAVSDILLTAKGDAPYPMALPLRAAPVFHTSRGTSLAGAALKTVIFGRTLVSWAGPKRIADKVLNFILVASENGEREIVYLDVSRNSGVLRHEALQIQLIYHFIKANGDITLWAWRCQEKQLGNTSAIFGGSGGPAYADTTEVRAPDAERAKDDVKAILARAIGQLVTEAQTNDTLDQHSAAGLSFAFTAATDSTRRNTH